MVSLKKRKRTEEEEGTTEAEQFNQWETKPNKTQQSKSPDSFVDLNLDSPLPMEWQRCLDIKSGKMHFYDTRTRRTLEDTRLSHKSTYPSPNLDLELNLKCEPSKSHGGVNADDIAGEKEMLATVCARCHLLVMMQRESPSCPNCKFVHPPGLRPMGGKPTLRPFCCRD